MPRPRLLKDDKLRAAREWYARYASTPNFKTMAGRLGVSEKTLRATVRRTA